MIVIQLSVIFDVVSWTRGRSRDDRNGSSAQYLWRVKDSKSIEDELRHDMFDTVEDHKSIANHFRRKILNPRKIVDRSSMMFRTGNIITYH